MVPLGSSISRYQARPQEVSPATSSHSNPFFYSHFRISNPTNRWFSSMPIAIVPFIPAPSPSHLPTSPPSCMTSDEPSSSSRSTTCLSTNYPPRTTIPPTGLGHLPSFYTTLLSLKYVDHTCNGSAPKPSLAKSVHPSCFHLALQLLHPPPPPRVRGFFGKHGVHPSRAGSTSPIGSLRAGNEWC